MNPILGAVSSLSRRPTDKKRTGSQRPIGKEREWQRITGLNKKMIGSASYFLFRPPTERSSNAQQHLPYLTPNGPECFFGRRVVSFAGPAVIGKGAP